MCITSSTCFIRTATYSQVVIPVCDEHFPIINLMNKELEDINNSLSLINLNCASRAWNQESIVNLQPCDINAAFYMLKFYLNILQKFEATIFVGWLGTHSLFGDLTNTLSNSKLIDQQRKNSRFCQARKQLKYSNLDGPGCSS